MDHVVYRRWLVGLVLSLALVLLGIVDVRRGFLFSTYEVRTPFFVLHPWHAVIVSLGVCGALACYRRLQTLEQPSPVLSRLTNVFVAAIATLLVVDLFMYRLIPAARSLSSGRIGVDWLDAFGATGVWRPIALATSYLGAVWHATLLGILLAGLAQAAFPVSFAPGMSRRGLRGSLLGALCAVPQPFCSCCASAIVRPLARRGASTSFLLAFVVGAPMVNVTTLVLAGALLPPAFALTRIIGGIVVTVLLTYLVSRAAAGPTPDDRAAPLLAARVGHPFGSTALEVGGPGPISTDPRADTPARALRAWLRASARIALVVVPTLWVSSIVAAALFPALPSVLTNTLLGVVLASIVGTFFMIAMWSEIAMVLPLIQAGLDGPAAALLIVLPAISLPGLMILWHAVQRTRVVALLIVSVMLSGIVAGTLFL